MNCQESEARDIAGGLKVPQGAWALFCRLQRVLRQEEQLESQPQGKT